MIRTLKWYLHGLRQYTNFHGRASRTEFWSFCTVAFLIDTSALFLVPFKPMFGVPLWLLALATVSPTLAVSTRRLHDSGRSGWPLARTGALSAAQAAFWLGVELSHGKDSLAWAAALCATLAYAVLWITLIVFYCLPGQGNDNEYGPPAPKQPVLFGYESSSIG